MGPKLILPTAALAVVALLSPNHARADSIDQFTYHFGRDTFAWQLPDSPNIATGAFDLDEWFVVTPVNVSENGAPQVPATLGFFSTARGGGLRLLLSNRYVPIGGFGPELFSGNESEPTFLLGTFALRDFTSHCWNMPGTLTIAAQDSTVAAPEPASLLLTLAALGGLALLLRRKLL